jgi:hypothetical protein
MLWLPFLGLSQWHLRPWGRMGLLLALIVSIYSNASVMGSELHPCLALYVCCCFGTLGMC